MTPLTVGKVPSSCPLRLGMSVNSFPSQLPEAVEQVLSLTLYREIRPGKSA